MSKLKLNGLSVHYNDKVAVVNYSPELKILEEDKKVIELKVVSNTDFVSLYIVNITNEDFFKNEGNFKELEIAISKSQEYVY